MATPFDPPLPPAAMRALVGAPEAAEYDNDVPGGTFGTLAFGPLEPGEAYRRVFDFGCGCGRLARQLLKQEPPPDRLVGVDANREMVAWCDAHLHRAGVETRYLHHDVRSTLYAPDNAPNDVLPIHGYGDDFTLINCHSVFTHLFEPQTEHYLEEFAAMLDPRGLVRSTWFLFDRGWFPVMNPDHHVLCTDRYELTMAVYYDWGWVRATARRVGLKLVHASWTEEPGYQSELFFATGDGFEDLFDAGVEPPGTVLGFGPSAPPRP